MNAIVRLRGMCTDYVRLCRFQEIPMHRRDVIKGGLSSLAAAGWASSGRPAFAADWPTKPVRVIVPYAPGSATDLVPRTVFESVSAQVKQTIVIENRPAGGTTVGTSAVAKSDPDGHTILV